MNSFKSPTTGKKYKRITQWDSSQACVGCVAALGQGDAALCAEIGYITNCNFDIWKETK
jgi:hypothetical protein